MGKVGGNPVTAEESSAFQSMMRDDHGLTPLFKTIDFDPIYNAELLISMGADVNAKDKSGNTVLHKIANLGDRKSEMAKFMIAKGADVNCKNTLARPLCTQPLSLIVRALQTFFSHMERM